MEFRCKNRNCGRLIADVSDISMLPNVLECQHCHHVNIIRRATAKKRRRPAPGPIRAAPVPEAAAKDMGKEEEE